MPSNVKLRLSEGVTRVADELRSNTDNNLGTNKHDPFVALAP